MDSNLLYKLGKLPPKNDPRDLLLANYLIGTPPAPPPNVYYEHAVITQGGANPWPMYGNDQYGDCTCAAIGHMIQTWTANAGKLVTISTADIEAMYFVLSPQDDGCYLNQVLDYMRATGCGGHKVAAYVKIALKNRTQAMQALDLFGNIYLGVELPDAVYQNAPNGDVLHAPWYLGNNPPTGIWAPDPSNGHCVNVVAYDDAGLGLITWGEYKTCDWQFYDEFVDEAFAVLATDWFDAAGDAPPGFNITQLQADLEALKK